MDMGWESQGTPSRGYSGRTAGTELGISSGGGGGGGPGALWAESTLETQ